MISSEAGVADEVRHCGSHDEGMETIRMRKEDVGRAME